MLRPALLTAVLAFLPPLIARAATPAAPTTTVAPASEFGTQGYIEYVPGDLPLVFTSPHGGRLVPATIPDRTRGVVMMDVNTQELTRAIAAELVRRTGLTPHLVLSHLHRKKLDPNRALDEAAQGDPAATLAWHEFHAAIERATAAAVARHGFAFLVDVHGHGHKILRLELGYALEADDLNQPDPALDAGPPAARSTVRDLAPRTGEPFSVLIRGSRSLGALYERAGVPAVPSPRDPQPGPAPFFAGGYIVRRHAADPATLHVDGVQIETHRIGLRDTADNRAAFAVATAEVLGAFLAERYAYTLPAGDPAQPASALAHDAASVPSTSATATTSNADPAPPSRVEATADAPASSSASPAPRDQPAESA